MINKDEVVADNTIAVILDEQTDFTFERFNQIVKRSTKKRDWFRPEFYHCLPLTIGNQYGFTIATEFDFAFEWDGTNDKYGIKFYFDETEEVLDTLYPRVISHFGSGIITLEVPFMLKTPPGINLMTINPPNHVLPNITVMSGVVESDNIRYSFTFNLKIQIPNVRVKVDKGTPLAAFIPIPRYFGDGFELVDAETVFNESLIIEEKQALLDNQTLRMELSDQMRDHRDRLYFDGKDIYGNKFPDHQRP